MPVFSPRAEVSRANLAAVRSAPCGSLVAEDEVAWPVPR
jgi:hypothetical protein